MVTLPSLAGILAVTGLAITPLSPAAPSAVLVIVATAPAGGTQASSARHPRISKYRVHDWATATADSEAAARSIRGPLSFGWHGKHGSKRFTRR